MSINFKSIIQNVFLWKPELDGLVFCLVNLEHYRQKQKHQHFKYFISSNFQRNQSSVQHSTLENYFQNFYI